MKTNINGKALSFSCPKSIIRNATIKLFHRLPVCFLYFFLNQNSLVYFFKTNNPFAFLGYLDVHKNCLDDEAVFFSLFLIILSSNLFCKYYQNIYSYVFLYFFLCTDKTSLFWISKPSFLLTRLFITFLVAHTQETFEHGLHRDGRHVIISFQGRRMSVSKQNLLCLLMAGCILAGREYFQRDFSSID